MGQGKCRALALEVVQLVDELLVGVRVALLLLLRGGLLAGFRPPLALLRAGRYTESGNYLESYSTP